MALFSVKPTKLDEAIADQIASRTTPGVEHAAQILSWGADEHLLCLAAALCWLATRRSPAPRRQLANHLLASTVAAAALPHLLKKLIDQERPDRRARLRALHGIPLSGKRYDAFPSGHAVHMGALAGIACLLPRRPRHAVWSVATLLSASRVCLLAHWLSDVVAGAALGFLVERAGRPLFLAKSCLREEVRPGYGMRRVGDNVPNATLNAPPKHRRKS